MDSESTVIATSREQMRLETAISYATKLVQLAPGERGPRRLLESLQDRPEGE